MNAPKPVTGTEDNDTKRKGGEDAGAANRIKPLGLSGLHYNIQIHLPATKDVEVFNAIFKSIKEHLVND